MNNQTNTPKGQSPASNGEAEIIELLDAYLSASADLKKIHGQKPKPTPFPVPCTIEEHRKISADNFAAELEYEQRASDARNRLHKADTDLFKAIPPNVWIALPSRKISIGFETGTWGGHCHALHVAKDGETLKELPHVTYYP